MHTPQKTGLGALTEREKQTLRLIVRGHDAKSTAHNLGLSVHTINERLRDARRKMAVSSSREAARILADAEGGLPIAPPPHSPVDTGIGDDAASPPSDPGSTLTDSAGPARRRPRIIIGAFLMTFALGLLLLAAMPQNAPIPVPASPAPSTTSDPEAVDFARSWLGLLDQANWTDSYRATGSAFRKLNTADVWAAASREARLPLGAMLARTFVSQENLPAPPAGYEVLKFRTRFANKSDAIETVTLEQEDRHWRVVGVTIR